LIDGVGYRLRFGASNASNVSWLLEAQIHKEVRAAALQDRADIERHGYARAALAA
jgi:hypothetical protein